MKKTEFDKLWELIGIFWGNNPRQKDGKTLYAYWMALQPFDYADCRDAIVRQSRKQGVAFPDVKEIVAGLAPVEEDTDAADVDEAAADDKESDMARHCRAYARLMGVKCPEGLTDKEYLAWFRSVRDGAKEASA